MKHFIAESQCPHWSWGVKWIFFTYTFILKEQSSRIWATTVVESISNFCSKIFIKQSRPMSEDDSFPRIFQPFLLVSIKKWTEILIWLLVWVSPTNVSGPHQATLLKTFWKRPCSALGSLCGPLVQLQTDGEDSPAARGHISSLGLAVTWAEWSSEARSSS